MFITLLPHSVLSRTFAEFEKTKCFGPKFRRVVHSSRNSHSCITDPSSIILDTHARTFLFTHTLCLRCSHLFLRTHFFSLYTSISFYTRTFSFLCTHFCLLMPEHLLAHTFTPYDARNFCYARTSVFFCLNIFKHTQFFRLHSHYFAHF